MTSRHAPRGTRLALELFALVLAAGAAGCTECEESERVRRVSIPGASCTTGRCVEWRTGPCEKTCAAFLPSHALEVTGCTAPVPDEDDPHLLVVECRYLEQSCTTTPSLGSGRPQAAHVRRGAAAGVDPVGLFFAAAAEAEESSVHAFRELGLELARAGFSDTLVRSCEQAADDEERHRAIMTALARAHRAVPSRARFAPSRWPDLEAVARDNAESGCVDELWSAALTTYAAVHAKDVEVRDALRPVAHDEARHAELAEEVAEAIAVRLEPEARERLAVVRLRAVRLLWARVMRVADDHPLVRDGLFPPRAARDVMLHRLFSGPDEVAA